MFGTFNEFITEGTTNYLPGLSDDGTADWLRSFKDDIAPRLYEWLDEVNEKFMSGAEDEKDLFFRKWQLANMVSTLLQQGFLVHVDHVRRALEYYNWTLEHKRIEEFLEDSYEEYASQVSDTRDALSREIEEFESPDEFRSGNKSEFKKKLIYSPGFMKDPYMQ